jgi:MinD-like ATPase involved in chromosome partitioning or flagellar assembly
LILELEGIIVIVGNYGSGKTEVAVNLSINQTRAGKKVKIADLDLVNPYFRTREARNILTAMGIEVVLPPEKYLQADLPILSPLVSGMIKHPSQLTIIDAGGDDVGATVLAALADFFKNQSIQMIQVVNPFRPFTETISGCLKIKDEIEKASKLKITSIAGNANLMDETAPEHIMQGYYFVCELSEKSGLPLKFITVSEKLEGKINADKIKCPILKIKRQMIFPWMKKSEQ